MSAEHNKTLVRRYFDEMCNGRQLDVADAIFAPDYVYHEPLSISPGGTGPEAIKQEVSIYQQALPDARWVVHEVLAAEDDTVVARWTGQGTHQNDLNGLAPTGQSVRVEAIQVFRLRDGKIVESWDQWDALAMMQQLGVIPSPSAAGNGQAAQDPAAVARTIYDLFSRDALDRVLAYVTDDIEVVLVPFGQTFHGKEGVMDFMRGFKSAFPDIVITITNQFASGEQVVTEFTAHGRHTGPLLTPAGEVPPTGRTVDLTVCEVLTIRDGKIKSLHNYQDAASLMRQLGLTAEPAVY